MSKNESRQDLCNLVQEVRRLFLVIVSSDIHAVHLLINVYIFIEFFNTNNFPYFLQNTRKRV